MPNVFDQFDEAPANEFDRFDAQQPGGQPQGMTREQALAELNRRGQLPPGAVSTMGISAGSPFAGAPTPATPLSYRQQLMQEMAQDVGPVEAGLVSAGQQFYNLARLVGFAAPAEPAELEAMQALRTERPIATAAGEAAPFAPLAVLSGGIAPMAGRVAASGALGALEGAAIETGRGEEVGEGAVIGGAMGMGAEILLPVVGRLGRKLFQRVTGRAPRGAMLDAAGRPTAELQEALDASGVSFADLGDDAATLIREAAPGTDPQQLARASVFAEEGIPATRGEITREGAQQAAEQRLLQMAEGEGSEQLRQFKLTQSEKIREGLGGLFEGEPDKIATGESIKTALTSRKKVLSTQKRELYDQAAEAAKDAGGVPVFVDSMAEALPDADTLEDLAITAGSSMDSLDKLLTKYGVKEPTEEMVEKGFQPTPLTIKNVERFRKSLNAIERGDPTGATSIAVGPVKQALDVELDELADTLAERGLASAGVADTLKKARATVSKIKREFSPNQLAGQLIGKQKDRYTELIDASSVYDKMARKSTTPEQVGNTVKILSQAGDEGAAALRDLQATVVMDLLDAGFKEGGSRKIAGKALFNPTAFNKRLAALGEGRKIDRIFANNPEALKRLRNFETIARELTPEGWTVPKGSGPVNLDIFTQLISQKIPGVGPFVSGMIRQTAGRAATGAEAAAAVKGVPEVAASRSLIEQVFPSISAAIGITAATEEAPE